MKKVSKKGPNFSGRDYEDPILFNNPSTVMLASLDRDPIVVF